FSRKRSREFACRCPAGTAVRKLPGRVSRSHGPLGADPMTTLKRPRILQVTKLYPPVLGGVETMVADLSEALAADYDVTVLCCQERGPRVEETIRGVNVVRCASWARVFSLPLSPG